LPARRGPATIVTVRARETLDSRGNPTVEAEVETSESVGRATVPSGASTGKHEAVELRDGDPSRFHGKGVLNAVSNVKGSIAAAVRGLDASDQAAVDRAMIRLDGTPNKGRLGANAMLAVSMAATRAAAAHRGVTLFEQLRASKGYTLPVPMMNVINGGLHAGNKLSVQEFLIEPVGAKSCGDAIRAGSEVYQSLKSYLSERHGRGAINVGDEGGFAPPFESTSEALSAIRESVRLAGYSEGEVRMGIDAAASSFFDPKRGKYSIDGATMSWERLEDHYARLADEFGLFTIEDPFDEESFEAFASITKRLRKRVLVIGDDIYVTNVSRIRSGIERKATDAILIKLNQIGTVSETIEAVGLARRSRWAVAISHRSGETEDPYISHLSTALGSEFIKAGAPARGERTAKYNELLRIEEALGGRAAFAGKRLR
jgi:enolase 1/2/3